MTTVSACPWLRGRSKADGVSLAGLDARALFERTISTFPGEKGRPLWERWSRYEFNFSDLAASQKLEQRMAEALPSSATSE